MGDNIKKYLIAFFLFFLFYLSIEYLLSEEWKPDIFEILKFFIASSFFILFKLSEDKKEYVKEVPFIFLISFIFAIPLSAFKGFYFLKKFSFLFLFTPLILRWEGFKNYLKENFILKDILYTFLYVYILFLILPSRFHFFPEIWAIFAGFFLLEYLKYFSRKVKFPLEEEKGVITYSKYLGFYPAIFFLLTIYFSTFFIFLSFWRGCNFSFVFPVVLLFGLLKVMSFLLLKVLKKERGLAEFLYKEAEFFEYTIYISFILESIIRLTPLSFLKI